MKKLLLLAFALALLAPLSTRAQDYAIDQGSYRVGGSASFVSRGGDLYEGFDDERQNTLLLNPSTQLFVAPGLAIGADALINRTSQGDVTVTTLSAGPSLAYFFGGPESTAYPFVSASPLFSLIRSEIDNEFDDFGFEATGFGAQFSGGVAFLLARNVAFTAEGFYLTESLKSEEADESASGNTFGVQLGVTAFVF